MTILTVPRQGRVFAGIAFAASILLPLCSCKSTSLETIAPTQQAMVKPQKPQTVKGRAPADKEAKAKSQPTPAKPSGGTTMAERAGPSGDAALKEEQGMNAGEGKRAWGTVYYIQAASAYSGDGGVSLRGPAGQTLGTKLSVKDFCRAAREGTVAVSGGAKAGTFNHAGWTDTPQTDCSMVFPRVNRSEIARFERTVFAPVPNDAPDGLGSDSRYRLVPYRTVAVDKSVFPLGTVLFIPKLKGRKTPIGVHDGYVFAGDTGVGVSGPHLDFFLGRSRANPAPDVFSGGPATRFDVQVVTDTAVIQRLRRQHLRGTT